MKQLRHYARRRQPAPPPSLPFHPIRGTRMQRLLTETWLHSPGAHLVHVVLTSLKSTDGLEMPWEKKKKTSPEYKRHRRKIEPWGIFTFPSEIHFFLLVRLRIWSQMPRNSMKLNRDAAAERTAGKLQRARTEPHSSASPLKTLCNETQMCDARVGSRLQASGCGLAPVDVGPVLQDLSAGTHLCQCSGLSPLPQSSRRSAPSLIFVSALPPDMFNVQQLLKKNNPNVPCVNHGCSSKCPDCLPSQQLTPQLFFFLAGTFLSVDSPAPAMFLPLSFSLPGKRKRPQ